MATKKAAGWSIGLFVTIGSIAGAASTTAAWWPTLGWVTPEQHNSDIDAALGKVDELDRLLRCEKLEARLQDLLRDQQAGDDSVETQRAVERTRERMDDLNCSEIDY